MRKRKLGRVHNFGMHIVLFRSSESDNKEEVAIFDAGITSLSTFNIAASHKL